LPVFCFLFVVVCAESSFLFAPVDPRAPFPRKNLKVYVLQVVFVFFFLFYPSSPHAYD